MSLFKININSDQLVRYTNRLEKLHKSALPLAVRGTLNNVAFHAKKNELEKMFANRFIVRKRNFIKSHSVVNKSPNTFNIKSMFSELGIRKGKSGAGDRLKFQEFGGNISNREKIPQDNVRIGRSGQRLVVKKMRYSNFNKPNGVLLKTSRQTIIKTRKGVFRFLKGGQMEVLYLTNLNVKIKKTSFLKPTAEESVKKTPGIFKREVVKRIQKELKRK